MDLVPSSRLSFVADLLLNNLDLAVIRTHQSGRIFELNGASELLLGVSAEDWIGSTLDSLLGAVDTRVYCPASEAAAHSELLGWALGVHSFPLTADLPNGSRLALELSSYFGYTLGIPSSTIVIKIADEYQLDPIAARNIMTRLETLTRMAPVGIVELDQSWHCLHVNDKWCELSQLGMQESLGSGWTQAMHPDDVRQTLDSIREALAKPGTFEAELRFLTRFGELRWVSISATGSTGKHGCIDGILVIATDITERHHAREQLHKLAHHDTLTRLCNRASFLKSLPEALKLTTARSEVALLFLDLDGFKHVNDTLGHPAGDTLLKHVADRLREFPTKDDTVARLGGDEFTIIIRREDAHESADVLARRVISRLKQPYFINGQQTIISCSIGIALSGKKPISDNTLVSHADTALYHAKNTGRGHHVFYSADLDRERRRQSFLTNRLHAALETGEFEVNYQPQADIGSGRIVGFEALLRWPSAPQEHLGPKDFVPALENAGLIGAAGSWVLRRACRDYRQWVDAGVVTSTTRLSVNVSATQLGHDTFHADVEQILDSEGVAADRLTLEITESVLVDASGHDVLLKLKDLGVALSIDDFGMGYSSLAYLGQLPVNELKIDRSLITNLSSTSRNLPLVNGILALAKSLGLHVVAEGVESADVLPLLEQGGCSTYQGYYCSRPLPATSIARVKTPDEHAESRQFPAKSHAS